VDAVLSYRGRRVSVDDVAFIRELIARHPEASRRRLSEELCRAWQWVQPNGALRSMVCRGLMLALYRGGHIELPPVRHVNPNPLAQRRRPGAVEVDQSPLVGCLDDVRPLAIRQVRRTSDERVFNALLETHHYLGYTQPVGEHLKLLVVSGERPVACLAFSSAPRHLGPRDRFIGWSAEARRKSIHLVAYNTRFLILPWVEVRHLASHVLGLAARVVSPEWQRLYGHPVYFLETFVDPGRFRGTCYRAANWVVLGQTTGRGKDDLTHRANRPVKDVLGYPLTPRFRELLSGER
jgi:hypothetical protein